MLVMEDCGEQTMLIIEASATNQNLNETAELALSPFELATNDVYDLKIKIQNIIKAPACDQTLVYLGHTLDDSEHLRDLYLRCGDTLNVVYPVKADIDSIDFLLQPFKDFETLIPLLCTSDGKYILQPLQIELKRLAVGLDSIYEVERLFYDLFNIYQTKSASSNRNYFKQVKGVEYLMSMLHFTLRQYYPGSESISDDGSSSRSSIAESSLFGVTGVEFLLDLIHYENVYNRFRRHLAIVVLGFLSIFLMEKHEVKLALQLGGLQPAMKWFLKSDEDVSNDFPTNLNLTSLCFLCSLVELDRNAQLQVAETEDVMEKLCDVTIDVTNSSAVCINGNQSCIGKHSMAAFILFYVSFDQRALRIVIRSGIYRKIIEFTMKYSAVWVQEPEFLVTIYYSLLFLARVRSATLMSIPQDQGLAIDACIHSFLKLYTPMQFATFEKESYIWRTLIPVVHLTFASGIPLECKIYHPDLEKLSEIRTEREDEKNIDDQVLDEGNRQGLDHHREGARDYVTDSNGAGTDKGDSERRDVFTEGEHYVLFPGSKMVQELGIFALKHILAIEKNRERLNSENINKYFLPLMWQHRETAFLKDLNVIPSQVPLLSLLCKGILARMRGLDAVFGLNFLESEFLI